MVHLLGLLVGAFIIGIVALIIYTLEKHPKYFMYTLIILVFLVFSYGLGMAFLSEVFHVEINS